jgi:hypothetical protein
MYNQLEFECILVGLLKRKSAPAKKSNEKRGRTQHVGFDLGSGHPLFALLKGFVRAKFRTPILPVVLPKFPGKNLEAMAMMAIRSPVDILWMRIVFVPEKATLRGINLL